MCSPFIYGEKPTPSSVADEKGNKLITMSVQGDKPKGVENVLRSASIMYGLFVGLAFPPFNEQAVKTKFVPNSISRCWRLGKAILEARKNKTSPEQSFKDQENGKLIFKGKVIDLHRRIERGYNFGSIVVQGFEEFKGQKLFIDFQNENLIAWKQESEESEKV